jgi:hypothetical protein
MPSCEALVVVMLCLCGNTGQVRARSVMTHIRERNQLECHQDPYFVIVSGVDRAEAPELKVLLDAVPAEKFLKPRSSNSPTHQLGNLPIMPHLEGIFLSHANVKF